MFPTMKSINDGFCLDCGIGITSENDSGFEGVMPCGEHCKALCVNCISQWDVHSIFPSAKRNYIDRKFEINAVCRAHNHVYTEANSVLFLAKDKAFLATLPDYRRHCAELGAGADQLKGIDLLIERIEKYQADNPLLVKVPDIDPVLEAHVIAPNK